MINIKHNRNKLIEGRNHGIAFGFLDYNNNTICPITPCKDYLNDIIYSEFNEFKLPTIYGLDYSPTGVFKDKKKINLIISNCNKDKFLPYYEINPLFIDNILLFINKIEDILSISLTTVKKENEFYIFNIDNYWINQIYLISLYTLLIRIGINYDDSDIIDYYNSKKVPAIDFNLTNQSFENFKKILKNKYLNIDTMDIKYKDNKYNIHNELGICSITTIL